MKKNRHKLTSLGYSLFALIVAILPVVWVSWANGQAQIASADSISSLQKNPPLSREAVDSTDSVDSGSIANQHQAPVQQVPQPTNNAEAAALLNQVTSRLSQHLSIEAKLHTETFGVFNTSVTGHGEYLQLGSDENLRVYLGLDFGSTKSAMKMVQTTSEDLKYLWSSCKTPLIEQATRIDLEKVKTALRSQPQAGLRAGPLSQISIAGLPGMVSEIAQRFDFAEVESGQVNQRPVWILRGKLNQASLARILKDESIDWVGNTKQLSQFNRWELLPHHLPHQVVIAIGQDDLFPYRIDFRRFTSEGKTKLAQLATNSASPLVSISLSSVKLDQPIDSAKFDTPLDIDHWKDDTVRYISSLIGTKPLISAQ
ncbi:MAG: hypothetical protein COA78_26830 [Blastopirellula sp.]|nr:MAG: hypothetical protein COA78_26830 [Blastopirellula sp.]